MSARRLRGFSDAWIAANPAIGEGAIPKTEEIDRILHLERIGPTGEKITYMASLADLPDGVFVVVGERPFLLWHGALYPWSTTGYGPPVRWEVHETVPVLTPRSTVGAIQQGYAPQALIRYGV